MRAVFTYMQPCIRDLCVCVGWGGVGGWSVHPALSPSVSRQAAGHTIHTYTVSLSTLFPEKINIFIRLCW